MSCHRYLPHTPEDVEAMLARCGARSIADLYADVPESLRLKKDYALPKAMTEPELKEYFAAIAAENKPLRCFAGGGFYRHYAPAAVAAIASRSEFATAYTPYQPEISQGTLQYIFEYQSMMASLTGLDISNASIYDGATATAEAMLMAVASVRRKKRVLISATVDPVVARVAGTYAAGPGITVEVVAEDHGVTDREALRQQLGAGDVAAVIVASPNRYGILEDYTGVADEVHAVKALMIMNCPASTLGMIRTPGEWGADIACGEAQSLGFPLNYGGPGLGYLCCRREYMRKMPGRIVGATTDERGRRCFVLTLQAREQHIRRQKATSNICSNQGIMTLYAAAYLSLLGARGLRRVNEIGCEAAHALAAGLCATGKFELTYPEHAFLNEFALTVKYPLDADKVLARCAEAGILGGVKIDDNCITVACTEMNSPEDVRRYVELFQDK